MQTSADAPTSVKAAQGLFFVNVAIWLSIGVASLLRVGDKGSHQPVLMAILAVLMFGNALAMFVCGWGLGRRQKRFDFLALAVLVVNVILTFTDQFGWLDFISLVIDLILLGLLVIDRKRFLLPAG